MTTTTEQGQQTQTVADRIAIQFDDDGTVFTDAKGRSLMDVCRDEAEDVTSDGFDRTRFDFADGSSIVVAGDAWDLGLPGGCYCWAGANHGHHADDCDVDRV